MTGFDGSSPSQRRELLGIVGLRAMEHDPVEEPVAPAREVVHQLPILLLRQLEVLPVLARLAHQRVMVGVVVAEDEPALAVGHVPRRDVHAFLPRDLTHDPPRHVDAVREDRRRELDRSQQSSRRERHAQRRLEVPAERSASAIGSSSSEPVAKNLSAPACACSPITSPSSVYDWNLARRNRRSRCGWLRPDRQASATR